MFFILNLLCCLQIALFYVAVLAGLLHRFPVSFSQVRIFILCGYIEIHAFCKDILVRFKHVGSRRLGRWATARHVVREVLRCLNKGILSLLLMLQVLMRRRRSWKKSWYARNSSNISIIVRRLSNFVVKFSYLFRKWSLYAHVYCLGILEES